MAAAAGARVKVDETVSADVVDRRRHAALGAIAGALVAFAAMFGVHLAQKPDPDRDLVFVVSTALDRGQHYWEAHVPNYRRARVVLFDGSTSSACGRALASSGPFYCPGDEEIYVDLSFLRAIDGELARAYVINHELGHHVQKMRGELDRDAPSVRVELEADCYAGEQMRSERELGHLDTGDVPGALQEAAAVGDDRLCPGCSPETWTHGSADQRVASVQGGLVAGDCHL
jgi:predicted metalloprotease